MSFVCVTYRISSDHNKRVVAKELDMHDMDCIKGTLPGSCLVHLQTKYLFPPLMLAAGLTTYRKSLKRSLADNEEEGNHRKMRVLANKG